jgi:hypothetical protein
MMILASLMRRLQRPGQPIPEKTMSWDAWIARSVYSFRCAALSMGCLLLVLTTARAADPERIELRYEMFGLAGIHVATNLTVVEETTEQYAITTDVESRGIAAIFVNLTSHSEVRGRLTIDGERPRAYRGEVHRNGIGSRNRVDYAADGTVTGEASPPAESHLSVAPALTQGTVDQLTAFFMVERQLAHRGSCRLDVAVYDGRRRYDLHFTDTTPEVPPAFAERNDVGATQVCHMSRQAIAGFSDSNGQSEGVYEGRLWYARLKPGDLIVPIQMEYSTEFGSVTGRLAELRGRGIHLQFMEEARADRR